MKGVEPFSVEMRLLRKKKNNGIVHYGKKKEKKGNWARVLNLSDSVIHPSQRIEVTLVRLACSRTSTAKNKQAEVMVVCSVSSKIEKSMNSERKRKGNAIKKRAGELSEGCFVMSTLNHCETKNRAHASKPNPQNPKTPSNCGLQTAADRVQSKNVQKV